MSVSEVRGAIRYPNRSGPFGTEQQPLGIVGMVGIDGFVEQTDPPRVYPSIVIPRHKRPVTFAELEGFRTEHGIIVPSDREYVAHTGGNFATSSARARGNEAGMVIFFTSMVPSDDTSIKLEQSLEDTGVHTMITPHVAKRGEEKGETRNPYSLVLAMPDGNRSILVAKPQNAPTLIFNSNSVLPGALVVTPLGGKFAQTLDHANAYARDLNIPTIVIAGESQLKKLKGYDDGRKAFLKTIRQANGFLGNRDEAILTLEAAEQTPPLADPVALVQRTKRMGKFDIVVLTNDEQDVYAIDGEDTVHRLQIPSLPIVDVLGPVRDTTGGGDEFAAKTVWGIQIFGGDEHGMAQTLRRAGQAAATVVTELGAQTAQVSREELFKEPHHGFIHTIVELRRDEPTIVHRPTSWRASAGLVT